MMRQEESYLGYLKTRQEMLEEIEREWERPKVFDRQIEEVEKVQEGPSKIEEKLKIIQVPGVQFFESPLPEVLTELQKAGQSLRFDRTGPRQKRGQYHPAFGRRGGTSERHHYPELHAFGANDPIPD